MRLGTHFSDGEPDAVGFEAFVPRGTKPRADYKNCDKHFFVPRRVESVVDLSRLAPKVAALPVSVAGIDDMVWGRIRAILAHPIHVYETRAGRVVVALRRYAFCLLWGRAEILVGRHISGEIHFAESIDGIAFAFRKAEWAGVLALAVTMDDGTPQTDPPRKAPLEVSVACLAALKFLRRAGVLRELRRCVRQAVGIDREVLRLAVRGRSPWDRGIVRDAAFRLAYEHKNVLLKIERETPGPLPLVFYAAEAGVINGIGDGAVGAVKRALRIEGIPDRVWRILAKSKSNPFRAKISGRHFEEHWDAAVDYCKWLEVSTLDRAIPAEMLRAIQSREEPGHRTPPLWLMAHGEWPVIRTGLNEYWRRAPEDRERFIAEEFLQVMDWAWTEHPKFDANQMRAGWRWMLKQARLWAEYVEVMKRCSDLKWDNPVPRLEHAGLVAVALDTPLALWEEAQALRHCAAIYDEKCAEGTWLVYSIRNREGKRLASASFKRLAGTPNWQLDAVREFANADAKTNYKPITKRIAKALGVADKQRILKKNAEAEAAKRMVANPARYAQVDKPTMTEEQIQAELQRPRARGRGAMWRDPYPGETCFGGGSGIATPVFLPQRPRGRPKAPIPSAIPTMTEEQIQAELQRMRDQGYGTVELSFAEAAMRGLEGKPQGNA